VAVIVARTSGDDETAVASEPEGESPTAAVASDSGPDASGAEAGSSKPQAALSLETVVWTTDAPSTLQELARTWSIPRDTLAQLNPKLPAEQPIEAETKVVVYSDDVGPSASIGPANDGKLTRGVPLPEGRGWLLPEDRGRAFATAETIASVVAALEAYVRRFPDAEPIQVGELSARRGGEIYGHQSHQSGRDIDIRLIKNADGDGFDAQKNWFLVKTLIDAGDVHSIFLNRTEQPWLLEAAVEDVGETSAEKYFELISHEPGHTIHMHVRFVCPDKDKRCVNNVLAGSEDVSKPEIKRLSPGGGSKLPTKGTSKLPSSRSKAQPAGSRKKKTLKSTKKPR
jgi:penicillin-insensitive murein endopeptidase